MHDVDASLSSSNLAKRLVLSSANLLPMIFAYLPLLSERLVLARVCQRWRRMALCGTVRRLTTNHWFTMPGKINVAREQHLLDMIIEQAPLVTDKFNLKSGKLTRDTVTAFAQRLSPALSTLKLAAGSYSQCGDDELAIVAARFRQLHTLKLRTWELTDAGLRALAGMPLRSLTLHHAGRLDGSGVLELVDRGGLGTHLRDLRLINAWNTKAETMVRVFSHTAALERVSLRGCHWAATDESITALCASCPQLRNLDLTGCINIGNATLAALEKHSITLERLALRGCSRVSDDGMWHLSRAATRLEHLDALGLFRITDGGAALVVTCAPRLRCVSFARCSSLTNRSLAYMRAHGRSLRHLDVRGCMDINDDGLLLLAAPGETLSCTSLSLSAGSSAAMSSVSTSMWENASASMTNGAAAVSRGENAAHAKLLRRAAAAPPLPLEHLSLSSCHGLTRDGVLGIITALRSTLKRVALFDMLALFDHAEFAQLNEQFTPTTIAY